MKKFIIRKIEQNSMAIHESIDDAAAVAAVAATRTVYQIPYHATSFLQNEYERTVQNIYDASLSMQQEQHQQLQLLNSSYNSIIKNESIKYWSKADLLKWLGNMFLSNSKNPISGVSLENFLELTDSQVKNLLWNMDLNEFIKLDENCGKSIYESLCELEKLNNKPNNNNNNNSNNNVIQSMKCDSLASSDSSHSSDSSMPFLPSKNQNSPFITNKNTSFLRIENGKVIKPEKKTKDCVHVWQFCRDLLQDSSCNPRLIEWLDQKQLVFKIKNKEEVALLWGKRKNRKSPEKMSYENMSRGMRHSRVASDYFRVPDKKLKKNLSINSVIKQLIPVVI